jgi:mannose-6-phosphate isomerase-like protein (cupin superfamily)
MDYELNEIADESKEFIVEIFREEIRNLARDNMNFLQVLSTGPHSQVLVMSLLPGEDLGEGISHSDQFVIVEQGTGELTVEGMTTPFGPGEVVHIPGGLHHNLRADTGITVKLAVVCAPAVYPPVIVSLQKQKPSLHKPRLSLATLGMNWRAPVHGF